MVTGTRIDVLRTSVGSPKDNAICERFIISVRRECQDHLIILSGRPANGLIDLFLLSEFNYCH